MADSRSTTEVLRLVHAGAPPEFEAFTRALAHIDGVQNTGSTYEADAFDAMCSTPFGQQIDAVVAQLPFTMRKSFVGVAFDHKKALFVTSPISRDAEKIGEVDRRFREAGIPLLIAQSQRYTPAAQTIKSAVDSGKLGVPGLLRIHRWDNTSTGDDIWQLQPDLDLARWLFGAMPLSIYTTGQQTDDGAYHQVHLGFPNGGMALIDHAVGFQGSSDYYSLSLIGSTGAAYADDHHNQQLLFGDEEGPRSLRTGQGDVALTLLLREFVKCIADQVPTDNAQERDAVSLTAAALLSFENRRPAQLREGQYDLA
ncbi:MAG: hypothetical protein O2955_07045 [Planctomycetota bacterium]|nr:hypothetical protein [Planctomycetota bacterium]MDA1212253.1 hypothetical protein [Planctomycetota bacterium]